MRRLVPGLTATAALVAACTAASPPPPAARAPSAGTSTSTTTSSSSTSTSTTTSSLDTLAPYLAQAGATDASLRTAAADVNGDVGATTLNLATATRAAIEAAAPTTAGNAIPAGLPDALLQRVMLVQSDLVSRWAALVGYSRIEGTTPLIRTDPSAQRALECLANGAAAAAATHADTGALEAAAAGIPPIAVAAPDTEAAADVQILLQDLELRNLGCAGCGGARDTALPPVEWYPSPKPSPISGLPAADGTVGSVEFTATYAPAAGWQITIHAC